MAKNDSAESEANSKGGSGYAMATSFWFLHGISKATAEVTYSGVTEKTSATGLEATIT